MKPAKPWGVEQGADSPRNSPVLKPRGAESGELGGQAQIDAGLVALIQAWPHLLEVIRAGMLAMVRASG